MRHAAGRAESVDANRQLLGGYSVTGEEARGVEARGVESRGEEGRGGRSHSDQLPASLRHSSLTSTVNAAMQGPSGATAAVQLLLTWIQASVVNQGSLGWGGMSTFSVQNQLSVKYSTLSVLLAQLFINSCVIFGGWLEQTVPNGN